MSFTYAVTHLYHLLKLTYADKDFSWANDHWKTSLLIVCQLESILREQGIYSLTSNLNFFLC